MALNFENRNGYAYLVSEHYNTNEEHCHGVRYDHHHCMGSVAYYGQNIY